MSRTVYLTFTNPEAGNDFVRDYFDKNHFKANNRPSLIPGTTDCEIGFQFKLWQIADQVLNTTTYIDSVDAGRKLLLWCGLIQPEPHNPQYEDRFWPPPPAPEPIDPASFGIVSHRLVNYPVPGIICCRDIPEPGLWRRMFG